MAKKSKVKTVKRSPKESAAPETEPELPNLVQAMAKLVERLESVERKLDQVLGRVSNLQAPRPQPRNNGGSGSNSFQQRPSHQQHSQPPRHSNQPLPQQQYKYSSQNAQPSQHQHTGHNRQERQMYQAVCADCRKNCEVPFKPTAERPTYCKECYAQRKTKGNFNAKPNSSTQEPVQRQLHVTKKGVGKVTVSEIVSSAPAGTRGKGPKRKALSKSR